MARRLDLRIFGITLLIAFGGCTTPEKPEVGIDDETVTPTSEFSLEKILRPEAGPVGCRKMLDAYCSALHSPDVQGNLWVGHGDSAVPVMQGHTKNDFSNAYFFYARAKIRAKDDFPSDFHSALETQDYFGKLSKVLSRPARDAMTLDARIRANRREQEADRIWNAAIMETVLRRLGQKFPGFHQLPEDLIPIEQAMASSRIRRELISEISRMIWKRDRNWAKVESSFEKLRHQFLIVVDRLDIPEGLREVWKKRLRSVKLVIPGAVPAIADAECSAVQANAFYYPHFNIITVCAGDFNSEDILQTVAHELGHAIDIDHSMYLFQNESELGKTLKDLRKDVCTPKAVSCSEWASFKAKFGKRLDGLLGYIPELPDFQRCLERRIPRKALNQEDVERLAESGVNDHLSNLAASGVFLRITKDRIPLPNGKSTPNPNYLNPCNYRPWSQGEEAIDDDLTQLLFFTAEYRCSAGEPGDRLRSAIALSKEMAIRLNAATIRMEGEFSSRQDLEMEGYASSPVERFADVLGSYAFAGYLATQPDVMTRRYSFLASTSWQCDRPSLSTLYPDESRVQEGFVFDSHSETDERKKEIFTAPIRAAVDCAVDFKFSACELKFKDGLPPSREHERGPGG